MASILQLRRGTEAEAATFIGSSGELFVDTENNLVYLHDGVTAGGHIVGGGEGVVSVILSSVLGDAPESLNTLGELSNAINDDPYFHTTVSNELATKANLAGATFTGPVEAPQFIGDGSLLSGVNTSNATSFTVPGGVASTFGSKYVKLGVMGRTALTDIGALTYWVDSPIVYGNNSGYSSKSDLTGIGHIHFNEDTNYPFTQGQTTIQGSGEGVKLVKISDVEVEVWGMVYTHIGNDGVYYTSQLDVTFLNIPDFVTLVPETNFIFETSPAFAGTLIVANHNVVTTSDYSTIAQTAESANALGPQAVASFEAGRNINLSVVDGVLTISGIAVGGFITYNQHNYDPSYPTGDVIVEFLTLEEKYAAAEVLDGITRAICMGYNALFGVEETLEFTFASIRVAEDWEPIIYIAFQDITLINTEPNGYPVGSGTLKMVE